MWSRLAFGVCRDILVCPREEPAMAGVPLAVSRMCATRRLEGTPWGFSRYESDIIAVPPRGAVVSMWIRKKRS
ncbi:jg8740 [Pararge aegeria aegeria]|uniref:Jg8740 protein n=1 Tax=Pararge aegeria aegeria TaxID=348720 RepID=A0A8S4QQD4_9NEOP|nr:jg8740 [Pararge aegeria aegeria]